MNGSECHSPSGPGGTTSVCPAKQTSGWASPRRAQRLSTAPKRIGSQRKPDLARRARRRFWQPPSSGVTDRRAMSSLASSSAPASGIRVDLEVAEGSAGAGRQQAFLFLARRGALTRGRRAGDLVCRLLLEKKQNVGGRVSVRHRLVLGYPAVYEQLEQRLLEGLGAGRHALLQRVLDVADLAFFEQLGDVTRVEQHLGGDYPGAGLRAHQSLRDHRLQRGGEVEQQARPVLERVEVDDAVHRVIAVVRVQRG